MPPRRPGLPRGLPVIAGAGDGQLAGLGAAACRPGVGYLNLGTAVALGVDAPTYRTDDAFRLLASPIPGRWIIEAILASGALSVSWFRAAMARTGEPARDEWLESLAVEIAAGSEGLLFLPYLNGMETPVWDPDARGAWVGLREHHGPGHLYRAILEGIAFAQRASLDRIETQTGQRVDRLRVMGGGSRSRLWLQVLADVLARPIEATDLAETTALGAGILAASADRAGR